MHGLNASVLLRQGHQPATRGVPTAALAFHAASVMSANSYQLGRLAQPRDGRSVSSCDVSAGVPYDLTPAFLDELLNKHRIDYVIHGDDPCILPGAPTAASSNAIFECCRSRCNFVMPRTVSSYNSVGSITSRQSGGDASGKPANRHMMTWCVPSAEVSVECSTDWSGVEEGRPILCRWNGRVRVREEDRQVPPHQAHGGGLQHRYRGPHAHVHPRQPPSPGSALPASAPSIAQAQSRSALLRVSERAAHRPASGAPGAAEVHAHACPGHDNSARGCAQERYHKGTAAL